MKSSQEIQEMNMLLKRYADLFSTSGNPVTLRYVYDEKSEQTLEKEGVFYLTSESKSSTLTLSDLNERLQTTADAKRQSHNNNQEKHDERLARLWKIEKELEKNRANAAGEEAKKMLIAEKETLEKEAKEWKKNWQAIYNETVIFDAFPDYVNYIFSSQYQRKKNRGELNKGMGGALAGFSVGAVLLFVPIAVLIASAFVVLPAALVMTMTFLAVISVVYLGVLAYGIINDLLAVRQNLVYFFAGHQPSQKSMIKSNDKNSVAVSWGILATGALALGFALAMGAMAGVAYGLSAAVVAIGGAVSAVIPSVGILPALVTMAVALYALGHLTYTLVKSHKHAIAQSQQKRNPHYHQFWSGLNAYTKTQYRKEIGLDSDKASKALGNSDRNEMGYNLLGFGVKLLIAQGSLLGASIIVASIPQVQTFVLGFLSSAASSALSTYAPAVLGGVVGLFVLVALIYLAATHSSRDRNKECYREFDGNVPETARIESSSIFHQPEDVSVSVVDSELSS